MDEGGGGPTHGHLAGFSPRKSSYLRISPTLVLQLILYLEPHHVEWMNVRNCLSLHVCVCLCLCLN
jgi:hypothetical protein